MDVTPRPYREQVAKRCVPQKMANSMKSALRLTSLRLSPLNATKAQQDFGIAKPLKATLPYRAAVALQQIRILVAGGHPIIRDGLRGSFAMQPDFVVVGEAHEGAEALRLADELSPDIMVLDCSMPTLSGLEVMRMMSGARRPVRTIVLTAAIEKPDIVKLFQCGARGIVLKDSPIELVFKSIRKVHGGEVWISRDTMADVVDALASLKHQERVEAPRGFGLTPREREILRLVVEADTNKGIAGRLSIGENTVKHHLTSIFNKTGASSRLELALFALHHRLIKETPRS